MRELATTCFCVSLWLFTFLDFIAGKYDYDCLNLNFTDDVVVFVLLLKTILLCNG